MSNEQEDRYVFSVKLKGDMENLQCAIRYSYMSFQLCSIW